MKEVYNLFYFLWLQNITPIFSRFIMHSTWYKLMYNACFNSYGNDNPN